MDSTAAEVLRRPGVEVKQDRERDYPLYKEDEIGEERETVLAALDLLIDNAGKVRKACARSLSVAVDAEGRRIS